MNTILRFVSSFETIVESYQTLIGPLLEYAITDLKKLKWGFRISILKGDTCSDCQKG